ncbi:ArsR/SmtB family transcription factor [Halogeometricum luteum]|uniref:Helix-turn-helix domain-containing protein n=1 Tax=Halogeometricum luteum TaxID=2950537 RepID=A0ABU2G430_9EURY|nr:helix-turn-helix domain-containing protein [Halogeometricum sp. S3BR5-2]MDS0295561.1 helix-turn-helix domain-containing protein [Halogeometricum sp. S3BR5-2]
MSEDSALGELLDVLSDEYARDILAATSIKPMSAQQLADECEMSEPTVYRRVERLRAHGLLEEQTRVRTSNNNYSVYTATLSEVSITLDDGAFEAALRRTDEESFPGEGESDTADRFTRMWEDL